MLSWKMENFKKGARFEELFLIGFTQYHLNARLPSIYVHVVLSNVVLDVDAQTAFALRSLADGTATWVKP